VSDAKEGGWRAMEREFVEGLGVLKRGWIITDGLSAATLLEPQASKG